MASPRGFLAFGRRLYGHGRRCLKRPRALIAALCVIAFDRHDATVTITRRLQLQRRASRAQSRALRRGERGARSANATTRTGTGTTTPSRCRSTGPIDERTGYVIDLGKLKAIVEREVVDKVDHRNFNLDVEFMRGIIPTTENIVVAMWRVLEPAIAPGRLTRSCCGRRQNNYVEYDGR